MKIPFFSRLFGSASSDTGWLALDFGMDGVHSAQISFSGIRPKVIRCEYRHMADLGGDTLERISREARFPDSPCSVLLAFGEYQMLMVEAPVVPADELKTAIRWKIKDGLNFHVEDATVDVLQIPKYGAERVQSLYAIAAENSVVQEKIALFERAHLALNVIDIRETAQRNIAALYEQDERALVLLAFDENAGLLTFTAGGELFMSRRLEISAAQLREFNHEILTQTLSRIELEVQRSLDYFDRQYNHIPVSRLIVSAPKQSGLVEFLVGELDVKIETLDLSQVMDVGAVPELADAEFVMRALPVIGAALRRESRTL